MVKYEKGLGILDFIRSDVMFWITIIGIIVAGVVKFQELKASVKANELKTESDHELLMQIDNKVDILLEQQTMMNKDIEYLIKSHNQ